MIPSCCAVFYYLLLISPKPYCYLYSSTPFIIVLYASGLTFHLWLFFSWRGFAIKSQLFMRKLCWTNFCSCEAQPPCLRFSSFYLTTPKVSIFRLFLRRSVREKEKIDGTLQIFHSLYFIVYKWVQHDHTWLQSLQRRADGEDCPQFSHLLETKDDVLWNGLECL